MKVTFKNSFHNTEATVIVGKDGKISSRQIARAAKKLCGMSDCCCDDELNEIQFIPDHSLANHGDGRVEV